MHLGDLVNKVAECDLDWFCRAKLIDCICNFILLSPQIGQVIISQLQITRRNIGYQV